MYTMDICIDDILRELDRNHKVTNKGNVIKAYNHAKQILKLPKRKTGEAYIMHSLRVAYLIAAWGFESDVICAALLHGISEIQPSSVKELADFFSPTVIKLIHTSDTIDNDFQSNPTPGKEELEYISSKYLQDKLSEKAFLIKIADVIDDLRTIDCFPEEQQLASAKFAREIVLPILLKEEAYHLIDIIEDLCLKIEHPERYHTINTMYAKLRHSNNYTTAETLKLFSQIFSAQSPIVAGEFATLRNSISSFTYNPRSSISVYRQINAQAEHLVKDLPKLLHKKNIAMYDLTLIINDNSHSTTSGEPFSDYTPNDIFLALYENFLATRNICLLDYSTTSYKDSKYYVLCDEMDNLYRVFVKSETEYRRYKLGHIIDIDPPIGKIISGNNKKIKLFKRDHSSLYIDAGATMLDFAFAIHSEIGLHFDYALIDDSKTQHKAYERLNEGDTITIVTNPDIEPNLQWFRYIKTSKATDHLIKHLSQTLVNQKL